MAENILGILFVTSTSKGRNVLRYPPDPTSPHARLSQPIYPSNTYTAQDTTVDLHARKRLFPGHERRQHHGSSGHNRHDSVSQFRDERGRGSVGGTAFGSGAGASGFTRVSSSKAVSAAASSRPSQHRDGSRDALDVVRGRGSRSKIASIGGDDDDAFADSTSGRPTPTMSRSNTQSRGEESDGGSGASSSDTDTSSSDDAEYNGLWESSVLAVPAGRGRDAGGNAGGPRRGSTETEVLKDSTPRIADSAVLEPTGGRRESLADSEGTSRPERGSRKVESASKAGKERDKEKERERERGREKEREGGNEGDGVEDDAHEHDTFIEDQYTHALGYSLDFLSDLLTPPRAACNRKFEVCVDELVFVGHPVCIGKDGRWAWPNDEDDEDGDEVGGRRTAARGRRGREAASNGTGAGSGLKTVVEYKESLFVKADKVDEDEEDDEKEDSGVEGSRSRGEMSRHRNSNSSNGSSEGPNHQTPRQQPSSLSQSMRKGDDDPPILNTFHLVLVFDKPDPQTDTPILDGPGTVGMYDEAYREICFKWTAAAFALQVRDNWVGRESELIARHREKGMNLGNPVLDNLRQAIELFPMARSLNTLFNEIHRLKTKPTNSLFSTLATTLTIDVADIPITIVVSPRASAGASGQAGSALAAWRRDEFVGRHGWSDESDEDDEDEDDDWGRWNERLVARPDVALLAKQAGLRVEPWQTLLLLDSEYDELDRGGSKATGGGGVKDGGYRTPPVGGSRRGSKATVEEDDERALVDALVNACDVSKPLAEIAHALRFDLEGIVIPLARDLVQSQRAILVDVINIRLRTIVTPTTIADHHLGIDDYSLRFRVAFPTLPPLIAFLSSISASFVPFRDLLPSDAESDVSRRDPYLRALVWLLQNDLVKQVHTRARIFARPEVKRAAWIALWHRRRQRWMRRRRSIASSGTGAGFTGTSFSAHGIGTTLSGGIGSGGVGSPLYSGAGSEMVTPRASEAMLINPLDNISPAQAALIAQGLAQAPSGPQQVPISSQPSSVTRARGFVGASSLIDRLSSITTATAESEGDMDSDFGDDDGEAFFTGFPRATPGSSGSRVRRASDRSAENGTGIGTGSGTGTGGDGSGSGASRGGVVVGDETFEFSLDTNEPKNVPSFTGSIIFRPARAQKDEARWLRVIREATDDAILASKFDLCVQYFDGITTFEEIIYRTGLNRRELDRIVEAFKDDLIIFLHP